MLENADPFLR